VKNLLTCIVLISLCSCGQNSDKIPYRLEKDESPFGLPKENFYRSVTMESDGDFENMSINPEQKKPVLGDRAFYVNENYYVVNLYNVQFYSETQLESISVIDANPTVILSQVTKEQLSLMPKRELTNLSIKPIWGKKNLDNKDYDMLNKAYLVRTSAKDREGDVDYKSETTYLMWFECSSAILAVKEFNYACERNQLKFHYKVIDYKLNESKN
jgi:hypothetical protein